MMMEPNAEITRSAARRPSPKRTIWPTRKPRRAKSLCRTGSDVDPAGTDDFRSVHTEGTVLVSVLVSVLVRVLVLCGGDEDKDEDEDD